MIDSGKIVDIGNIERRIPIARGTDPNGTELKVEVEVGIGMAKAQMNHRGGKNENAQVMIDIMETVIVIVIVSIEGKGIPNPDPIETGVALAAAQVGNEIGISVDIEKRIDKGILTVIGTNLGNEDAWKIEVGAIETAGETTIEIEKHDSITNPNPNHSMMTGERTGSPQTFV